MTAEHTAGLLWDTRAFWVTAKWGDSFSHQEMLYMWLRWTLISRLIFMPGWPNGLSPFTECGDNLLQAARNFLISECPKTKWSLTAFEPMSSLMLNIEIKSLLQRLKDGNVTAEDPSIKSGSWLVDLPAIHWLNDCAHKGSFAVRQKFMPLWDTAIKPQTMQYSESGCNCALCVNMQGQMAGI